MPSSPIDYLLTHDPTNFRPSRLPSLYSDLSLLRTTNPEGFLANSHAWTSALTLLALSGNLPTEQRVIISLNDALLGALASSTYGRPVGLGVVIDEAVKEGKMLELGEFVGAEKSIYTKGIAAWGVPSVGAVVRWGLRTAGVLGSPTFNAKGGVGVKKGELVVVGALEEVAKKVVAWRAALGSSLTERIFTKEAFALELASLLQKDSEMKTTTVLNAKDLDVLLLYLSRDNPVLSYNGTAVKLAPSNSSTHPASITSEDTAIANLKSVITTLTAQVSSLEATMTTQQQRASAAVSAKNKPVALAALRSKKSAERALTQRTATLHQLEDVYTQIQQAADQVEVVATLKSSAAALKHLNTKVGSVESVDAVLEGLREEMQKTSEVGEILREDLSGEGVWVEGEVDDELEAMVREEREKVEKVEREKKEAEERRKEEIVQARLRELDALGIGGGEKEKEKENEDAELEKSLARSVENLKELSLRGTATSEGSKETQTQTQTQKQGIAEPS